MVERVFGSRVTVEDLDAGLTEVGDAAELTINFRATTSLEHSVLAYLLALTRARSKDGLSTLFELPKKVSTVDFMRSWLWPDAVKVCSNRPFKEMLGPETEAEWERISRKESRYSQYVNVPYSEQIDTENVDGRSLTVPTNYFALTPVKLELGDKEAATIAKNQWLDDLIQGVLAAWLGPHAERIATDVVYEAVLNSASHPKAKVAYSSGQLDIRHTPSGPKHGALHLAIWDDGATFANTLIDALATYGTIRVPTALNEDKIFEVRRIRDSGAETFLMKGLEESEVADADKAMVAAFMKGVTSRPVEASKDGESMPRIEGGRGLYVLRTSVIDNLRGQIRYLVGDTRMKMVAGRNAKTYYVSISRGHQVPRLSGNLLILDIPLR